MRRRAFSLVEILVALGVVSLLGVFLASGVQKSVQKANAVQCLAKLRAIGQATLVYATETGEFPRSHHSAAGAGQLPWSKAIFPYLSNKESENWPQEFQRFYRCPMDKNTSENIHSYALNVFFELTPDGDDYDGSPATWRRPLNVPVPAATILLAESKPVSFGDHLMCHMWSKLSGAANAVDSKRHGTRSNYVFADGHVEALPLEETFNPKTNKNLWNPSLASR